MSLSEHEQRMLDQIESALLEEDPKFVMNVSKGHKGIRGLISRNSLLSVMTLTLGLVLLIFGVFLPKFNSLPVFSAVGFVLLIIGGIIRLKSPKSIHKTGTINQRMEERFRRRFN